jgi:hypothetical protein
MKALMRFWCKLIGRPVPLWALPSLSKWRSIDNP